MIFSQSPPLTRGSPATRRMFLSISSMGPIVSMCWDSDTRSLDFLFAGVAVADTRKAGSEIIVEELEQPLFAVFLVGLPPAGTAFDKTGTTAQDARRLPACRVLLDVAGPAVCYLEV